MSLSIEQIRDNLTAAYRASCATRGFTVNAGIGSEFYNRASAIASTLADIRNEFDASLANLDARTADHDGLMLLASAYGIEPRGAVASTGSATVLVADGTTSGLVFIPDSLRLTAPSGEVYKAQVTGLVPYGTNTPVSVSFPIEAVTAGQTEVYADGTTFSLSQSILGLASTATITGLSRGADIESDDELRTAILGAEESDPNSWGWGRYARLLRGVPGVGSVFFYPCAFGPGSCGLVILAPSAATTSRAVSRATAVQAESALMTAQTELFQTEWMVPTSYTCRSAFITGDTDLFIDSVPVPEVRARVTGQSEFDYCTLTNVGGVARLSGNTRDTSALVGKTIAFMRNGRLQQHVIVTATGLSGSSFNVALIPAFVPSTGEELIAFPGVRDGASLESAILAEWGALGPGEMNPEDSPYAHRMARRPSKTVTPADIDAAFATRLVQRLGLSDGALHYADNDGVCQTPISGGNPPYLILPNGMGIYPA